MTAHDPVIGLSIRSGSPLHAEWMYTWKQLFRMLGIPFSLITDGRIPPVVIRYGEPEISIPEDRFVIRIPETVSGVPFIRNVPKAALRVIRTEEAESSPPFCDALYYAPPPPSGAVWMQDSGGLGCAVTVSERDARCAIDIPATAFYFFSLANERRITERDAYGRFRRTDSPLGSAIYDTPVVDRLVALLRALIRHGCRRQGVPPPPFGSWPGGRAFALALSHDVDRFHSWTWSKIRRAMKSSPGFRTAKTVLKSLVRPDNRSGNFRFIRRIEKRYGGTSTYFIAGIARSPRDPDYDPDDPRIRKNLGLFSGIGLHGSVSGASRPGLTAGEKKRVESVTGRKILGIRSHYLAYDHEKTFRHNLEAGFLYDSTLGFYRAPGWRCGTGLPFRVWDCTTRAELAFWELPQILMGTSLYYEKYCNLTAKAAWPLVFAMLQETARNRACMTINWHNNNLHPGDATGYTALYEKILDWTKRQNGWIASTDEIVQYFIGKDQEPGH
ncbi:MAG TPA: hypothetical protein ENN17_08070 [bacterium]|nr:hypothetical protein [bacterium]